MIPVCYNLRRYANKVFKGVAADGKGTMGWYHGFKLHLLCNDREEIITFCLTGANVDDRNPKVWKVLAKACMERSLQTEATSLPNCLTSYLTTVFRWYMKLR